MWFQNKFCLLLFFAFLLLFKGVEAGCKDLFITQDQQLTPFVIELLQLDGLYDPADTLQEVLRKTQKHWIAVRQGQQRVERTDLRDTPQQAAQAERVLSLIRQLGLIDEKKPSLQHYDYGLCLGAFLDGVRMRLSELVKAWQQGVRFDTLVFLTGERYLRLEAEDSFEKLCDPKQSPLRFKPGWTLPPDAPYLTEYDMVKLVWDQVQLPEDMAQALEGRVIFVNAPAGIFARPSTKDTYAAWLKDHQVNPGTILAISHPLLWVHQQLAGENILGPDFYLDTTAPALTPAGLKKYYPSLVSLVHDTIAKCLYETLPK